MKIRSINVYITYTYVMECIHILINKFQNKLLNGSRIYIMYAEL